MLHFLGASCFCVLHYCSVGGKKMLSRSLFSGGGAAKEGLQSV